MKRKHFKFTPEIDEVIKQRYPNEYAKDIAHDLGLDVRQVSLRASRLGIVRSEAFKEMRNRTLKEMGREVGFKAGHAAYKGPRLRKQNLNPRLPIGTERVNFWGYLERKVSDNQGYVCNWKLVHRIIWEEAHGPVPEGMIVVFLDGNKSNLNLDNLACMSNEEHLKRAHFSNYPEELRNVVKTLSQLKKEIKKK